MHAIQGAVAIRRERQKRQKRRMSKIMGRASMDMRRPSDRPSHDGSSQISLYNEVAVTVAPKPESSLTSFHLGVVFILMGFLMVFSSMIPNSGKIDNSSGWSRLLGVGTTFIILGLIMVMVNKIITQREEEELTKYVKNRLARSKSGQAIGARDLEGGLMERHQRILLRPPPPRSQSGGSFRRNGSQKPLRKPSIRVDRSPTDHATYISIPENLGERKRSLRLSSRKPSLSSNSSLLQNSSSAPKSMTSLSRAPSICGYGNSALLRQSKKPNTKERSHSLGEQCDENLRPSKFCKTDTKTISSTATRLNPLKSDAQNLPQQSGSTQPDV